MELFKPMRTDVMMQLQISNAWEHMVGVIMLNQTGGKRVKMIMPEFLYHFPTPRDLIKADPEFVKKMIESLGFRNVRYERLIKMSLDYLIWDGEDARKLYGIGKYGSDSYEIFFKKNYSVEPTDKELLRYLRDNSFATIGD